MITPSVVIAARRIASDTQPYVIAEISANHNGSLERALEIVDAAAYAGVDAIKLQTYTPDLLTLDSDGPDFVVGDGPWKGRRLYELYEEAQTPWDWHEPLFARARQHGLTGFSSAFDAKAIAFLETLNVPAYKIASFEASDVGLIASAAATCRPVIISTGMASQREIAESVDAARDAGCHEIALLHCVSGYPTPAAEATLLSIPALQAQHQVVVGLSDHTLGAAVPVAAVALGARIIEKHITLRRADGGPDSAFSLEPDEFKRMVDLIREASAALTGPRVAPTPSEAVHRAYRRSLYVVADMAKGEAFNEVNVRSIRPGFGLAPKHLKRIIGRRANQAIKRGTALEWSLID